MPDAPTKVSLDVADAVARVVAGCARLASEKVALADARGRVLTSVVRSAVSLPPWANSAMDGYAVRSADIGTVPARLRVTETVAAGQFPSRAVSEGEAVRIMTGAPVPEGADTVVRVEDTDAGLDTVEIRLNRDAGKNVRPRGEDITAGSDALAAGVTLGPAQLGVLAAVGATSVPTNRPAAGAPTGAALLKPIHK